MVLYNRGENMTSPFPYSSDNKRYHTLNYFYRRKFGRKLYKAVIDCGFTCPNIDGTKGSGGCIFCGGGSGYFTTSGISITEQLEAEKHRICSKVPDAAIVAYFQANTNTYAPVSRLREVYEEALRMPEIAGLSIGTRGDCLPEEVLDLLSELNSRTFLTVELGLQSVHNTTIHSINRCYSHEEFMEGYRKLQERNIRTCLHIINGLPGETPEMMIETARQAGLMRPGGVKLQMLHIIRETALAKRYEQEDFPLLSRDGYIDLIACQLELLPPETVVERITGDGDKNYLIAPEWTKDKIAVLGGIDKELARRNTWQGRKYTG